MTILNALLSEGIRLKRYATGVNLVTLCPKCSASRKKKTMPCLSVKIAEDETHAMLCCHHCGFGRKIYADQSKMPDNFVRNTKAGFIRLCGETKRAIRY